MAIRTAFSHRFRILGEGLSNAFENHARIQVVGLAHTSVATLELVRESRPDVLVLDPFLPDKDGLDLVAELLILNRNLAIVAVMMEPRPAYFSRLILGGVKGLISPECTLADLVRTISAVNAGKLELPAHLSMEILEEMSQASELGKTSALSNRELQVLQMIGQGHSKLEISAKLCISIKTVDSHRGKVLKKLGLRNNVEIAHFVLRPGFSKT